MEAIGLAIGVPGLLEVVLRTVDKVRQTVADAQAADHDIMDAIRKLQIESGRLDLWQRNMIIIASSRPAAEASGADQRSYQLIAITLGFIARAFNDVAKLDGKYGQPEQAQSGKLLQQKDGGIRSRIKRRFFRRSDDSGNGMEATGNQVEPHESTSAQSRSSVVSLSGLADISPLLKDLDQQARGYEISVSSLSRVTWALIGKKELEDLHQKVKGYNDDLETLKKGLEASVHISRTYLLIYYSRSV